MREGREGEKEGLGESPTYLLFNAHNLQYTQIPFVRVSTCGQDMPGDQNLYNDFKSPEGESF